MVNEGAAVTYDLATNTTDSDTSSGITYTIVSISTNGPLTDPSGSDTTAYLVAGSTLVGSSVKYTHNGSETTSDTFTFKANDGNSDSNTSTATVTVTAVNDAPNNYCYKSYR